MNKQQIFKNQELNLNVRAVQNDDGSISINLEDTARGLGFLETKISTSGERHIRWQRVNKYLAEFNVPTCGHDDFIPESVFYLLAMKAKSETAIAFQKWLAVDVIPTIRKTGGYNTQIKTDPMSLLKLTYDALEQTNDRVAKVENDVQGIREVVAIDSTSWREETSKLLRKIGNTFGDKTSYQEVRNESYKLLEKSMGVNLSTRLTNKRRRMAEEGICKSKRDRLNNLDIIQDDKKLIEGYVAIVKELAIKYGVGG